MRIGIDIDDTITNTWEDFMPILSETYHIPIDEIKYGPAYYDAVKELVTLEEYLAMSKESEHILFKVKLKPDVIDVLNRLKQDGHNLIFITARGAEYSDPYERTKEYLDNHNVPYDKIIVRAFQKGQVCQEEKIDLFIDDNIINCQNVKQVGIDVLLMEALFNKKDKEFTHVENWNQVYEYIKNRW